MQRVVHGLRVHSLKTAFRNAGHRRRLRLHLELPQVRNCNRAGAALQHSRQIRSHGHGAERRCIFFRHRAQRPVKPAILRSLHAGCSRLHVILRIKVRPRGVRRSRCVHNRQFVLLKQRRKRRQRRMQSEKSVEIDRRIPSAPPWLRNRDCRPQAVIVWLPKGHHNVQSVRRPALEHHHELLLPCRWRRGDRPLQKGRHRAQPRQRNPALLHEIPPREPSWSPALATLVVHRCTSIVSAAILAASKLAGASRPYLR